MGILTRQEGARYLINSDCSAADAPTRRPPKIRPADSLAVWTGQSWSALNTEAMTFETLDDADEYVKANFSKLVGQIAPTKPGITRPAGSPFFGPARRFPIVAARALLGDFDKDDRSVDVDRSP